MFPLLFTFLGDSFVFLDMGPSFLFFVFPLLFEVLWFIYDWQGFHHFQCSPFLCLGFTLHRNHLLFQSLFGKKEECVSSAGMELLRRMEYGGMFPCLILLLFMEEFTLDVE